MPMHYNQMLPPISRMARMNLGGLPTAEEEVEVITETPVPPTDKGTYGGEAIEETDVNSAGFRIKVGGQWKVIDPNDEAYVPATAAVTTPTAKPEVTVDYGTYEGQEITGVTETSAGTQVTLEDGSKTIVNKEDLTDKTVRVKEDTTGTTGTGKTGSGVPPVNGQTPPAPPITLQTPEGASFEVTEEDASDGTVTGPGGRTFKVKKDGDNWVMVTDDGQTNDLTSLGKGLMESFGIDKSDIMKTLLVYLGGRITGGSHGGSLEYALKYGLKHMEARQAADAKARAEAQKKYGHLNSQARALHQALESQGIDPTKATKKYIRTTGPNRGAIVETYVGTGGNYIVNNEGQLELLDLSGYEAYSVEQHGLANVQKNLRTHLNSFADEGDFKINVGDEKNPRFKFAVNPTGFSTAYTNYLKSTYGPNGYVYANTPEGRAQAESMYKAAFNWSNNTGKKIEHFPGFFNALNTGIYGADGHANVNVPGLVVATNGQPIAAKHYDGLEGLMSGFKQKHGNPEEPMTNGIAMKLALDAFENPQNEAERALVKKIKDKQEKGQIPPDSSAALEFVKLYFAQ